jgi:hypothetical protein
MSLALATKGIIAGFGGGGPGGDPTIAVPVCNPELTSEELGELRLSGVGVIEKGVVLKGKNLRPSIKIYD